jgi:uncharacterized membrane protein
MEPAYPNVQQSFPPGTLEAQKSTPPTELSATQTQSTDFYVERAPQNDGESSLCTVLGTLLMVLALTFMLIGPIMAFVLPCHASIYITLVALIIEAFVCLTPALLCLYMARDNMRRANGGGQCLLYMIVIGVFLGLTFIVATLLALIVPESCPKFG